MTQKQKKKLFAVGRGRHGKKKSCLRKVADDTKRKVFAQVAEAKEKVGYQPKADAFELFRLKKE